MSEKDVKGQMRSRHKDTSYCVAQRKRKKRRTWSHGCCCGFFVSLRSKHSQRDQNSCTRDAAEMVFFPHAPSKNRRCIHKQMFKTYSGHKPGQNFRVPTVTGTLHSGISWVVMSSFAIKGSLRISESMHGSQLSSWCNCTPSLIQLFSPSSAKAFYWLLCRRGQKVTREPREFPIGMSGHTGAQFDAHT